MKQINRIIPGTDIRANIEYYTEDDEYAVIEAIKICGKDIVEIMDQNIVEDMSSQLFFDIMDDAGADRDEAKL